MKCLTPALVVITIVAALFHSGPQQAWACTCGHPEPSEARSVYDAYDAVALVVVRENDGRRGRLLVERSFKGIKSDTTVEFDRGPGINSCDYGQLEVGTRHFVALVRSETGGYGIPHLCTSFPLHDDLEGGAPSAEYRDEFVAAMEAQAVAADTLWTASSSSGNSVAVYVFFASAVGGLAALASAQRLLSRR